MKREWRASGNFRLILFDACLIEVCASKPLSIKTVCFAPLFQNKIDPSGSVNPPKNVR